MLISCILLNIPALKRAEKTELRLQNKESGQGESTTSSIFLFF